jgi:hypothetical protein
MRTFSVIRTHAQKKHNGLITGAHAVLMFSVCMFGRLCTDLLNRIQNLLHGLVKYEGLQRRLSTLDDQLSDLNDVISKIVNKQNQVQYTKINSTKFTYECV